MDEAGTLSTIRRLLAIMVQLRDPVDGCEWDRAQSWKTIAPYTIEEAYEVADAIDRGDAADIKDELGDLLFQVVFHARIAEEAGLFDFAAVAAAIADKMERRHPHVFGDASASPGWEALKAAERSTGPAPGALDGVATGLPAVLRAAKLQARAARTGFAWPDASGPRAKIIEELDEVATAAPGDVEEEIGDLLFSVVNYARHLGVDPETALRHGNAKFERRFAAMEARAGTGFVTLDLNAKEALWQQVKEA